MNRQYHCIRIAALITSLFVSCFLVVGCADAGQNNPTTVFATETTVVTATATHKEDISLPTSNTTIMTAWSRATTCTISQMRSTTADMRNTAVAGFGTHTIFQSTVTTKAATQTTAKTATTTEPLLPDVPARLTVKLDVIEDEVVNWTNGLYCDAKGVFKPRTSGWGCSDYIAIEYAETLHGDDMTSFVLWDKNKEYIYGYWSCDIDIDVDPEDTFKYVKPGTKTVIDTGKIPAYITLNAIYFDNMALSPCSLYMTRHITVSSRAKTVELFGDSFSAFDGTTLPGRVAFYGETGEGKRLNADTITSDAQMWYSLLSKKTSLCMIRNDSYSGSCVSYSYYGGLLNDPYGSSFIKRIRERFNDDSPINAPDLIVIEGGSNDWHCAEMGTPQYSGWKEEDLNKLAPAICYIFDYLKHYCPKAKIVFVMNSRDGTNPYGVTAADFLGQIKVICEHYGVSYVPLSRKFDKMASHPSRAGMVQIADKIIYVLSRQGLIAPEVP